MEAWELGFQNILWCEPGIYFRWADKAKLLFARLGWWQGYCWTVIGKARGRLAIKPPEHSLKNITVPTVQQWQRQHPLQYSLWSQSVVSSVGCCSLNIWYYFTYSALQTRGKIKCHKLPILTKMSIFYKKNKQSWNKGIILVCIYDLQQPLNELTVFSLVPARLVLCYRACECVFTIR